MVDSFKFLPRLIAKFYRLDERQPLLPIPYTRLEKPLAQCRIALITTGGLFLKDQQQPFDVERERREPTWGDPSFRVIPHTVSQTEIAVSHLHINPEFILHDSNVALPLSPLRELVEQEEVGSMAREAYSLMGFQGFPPDTTGWARECVPEITRRMREDGVDGVVLVPT